MGLYGVMPLRLGTRKPVRASTLLWFRDDLNVPDVMQRVHWDPETTRRSGNPTTFDYGRIHETWLIHLCTDWMGDDAWLWKLESPSGASTTWATRSGSVGASRASTSPTTAAPRSISSCGHATSVTRSPRRVPRRSSCRAGSTGRCACPTRRVVRGPHRGTRRDRRRLRATVSELVDIGPGTSPEDTAEVTAQLGAYPCARTRGRSRRRVVRRRPARFAHALTTRRGTRRSVASGFVVPTWPVAVGGLDVPMSVRAIEASWRRSTWVG